MRRRAAAVPASQAKIGKVYAVNRNGKLTRFRVDTVTTHRVSDTGSPHDYRSEIIGAFQTLDPRNPTNTINEKATIKPNELLGGYEEYIELTAETERQNAERNAQHEAAHQDALDLRRLLYRISGQNEPNDPSEYRQLFRVGAYGASNEVDMKSDAVKPLLNALRKLVAEKEPA